MFHLKTSCTNICLKSICISFDKKPLIKINFKFGQDTMKLLPIHQYTRVKFQDPNKLDKGRNATEDQDLLNQLSQEMDAIYTFDHWAHETSVSCWPLMCASAAGHKKLNIDKMTTKPLVKTREGKRKIPDLPAPGWFDWLLGSGEHSHGEAFAEDEEEVATDDDTDEDNEEEIEEEEEIVMLEEDDDPIEMDEEDPAWYNVRLLGPSWYSVSLLGDEEPEHGFTADKDWFMLNLLEDLDLSVDLLGWKGEKRPWWSINLLGVDEKQPECVPLDHDKRAWSDVALLGACDDGLEHWWNLNWLKTPGAKEDAEEDLLGLDLLGRGYQGERNWFEVDLLGDRSPATEAPEEVTGSPVPKKTTQNKTPTTDTKREKAAEKEDAAKDAAAEIAAAQEKAAKEAAAKIALAKESAAKKTAAKEAAAKEAAEKKAAEEAAAAKEVAEKEAADKYAGQSWFSTPDPDEVEREAARVEAERAAAETARLEAERLEKEERAAAAAAAEAKRKAEAEAARLEAERIEAEKKAATAAARAKAAAEAAAEEANRLEASNRLEAARLEAARLEKEAKEQAESWMPTWTSSEVKDEEETADKNKSDKSIDNIEQLLEGENPELLKKLTEELYARMKKEGVISETAEEEKSPPPTAAPKTKKKKKTAAKAPATEAPKKMPKEEPVEPVEAPVEVESAPKLSETAEVVKNYHHVFLFTCEWIGDSRNPFDSHHHFEISPHILVIINCVFNALSMTP